MIKCLLSFDHIPLHDWESLFISFVIFHHMMKCYHIIYIKSHKETVTEQEYEMEEKERDRESMLKRTRNCRLHTSHRMKMFERHWKARAYALNIFVVFKSII